jgi:hypothetical protein
MAFDSNGYLYGCSTANTVIRITTASTPPTIATNWAIGGSGSSDCAVTVDSTYLYATQWATATLLRVALSSPIGTTMQSFGPVISSAHAVFINPYGLIFVSSQGNGRVDTIYSSNGAYQTTGVYIDAHPTGFAMDTTGGMYFADYYAQTVTKIGFSCPIPTPPPSTLGSVGSCTGTMITGATCQFQCPSPSSGGLVTCLYGSVVGGCNPIPCNATTIPNGNKKDEMKKRRRFIFIIT